MIHPWELTLREFVEKVERDYGITIEPATAVLSAGPLLNRRGVLFPVPDFDADDVLPLAVLRGLCWQFRLPPEDFGLDPEAED